MSFSEQIAFLRIVFLLNAASILSLVLLTNLTWTTGDLVALASVSAAAIFQALLLLCVKCPQCGKLYFSEGEGPERTKRGLYRALRARQCMKCEHPLSGKPIER